MQGPNPLLSDIYKTAATQPVVDDSSIDAFVKIAMDQGVDLDALTTDEVHDLYMKVAEAAEQGSGTGDEMDKAATDLATDLLKAGQEEPPPSEEEKKEDEEEGEKEAAFVKGAEQADFLGRIIAHAQWDELKKLAQEEATAEEKKEEEKEEGEKEASRSGGKAVGAVSGKAQEIARALKTWGRRQKHKGIVAGQKAKEHVGKQKAIYGGGLAGLAAGGAAGAAAGSKTGEDEAFQELVLQKISEKMDFLQQDAIADDLANRTLAKMAEMAQQ